MARYDRNPNKKSNTTAFFILAAIACLGIGAAGTYYVVEAKNAELQVDITENPKNEAPIANKSSLGLQKSVNKKPALLVADPNIAIRDMKDFPLPNELPDLLESDAIFRKTLITLSPGLAFWLDSDQLIRKYIIVANDFANGIRVNNHMSFLRLAQPFVVEQGKNTLVISPKSYNRYDNLAQAIQAINSKVAAAVYRKFKPLMQEIFVEFSYPQDVTLETIIKKGAADLLAAPVIEEPISLVRPSVHYKYADNNLEMLSPLQRQMLRMGPENTRIIQAKVREFMVELAKLEFK